ncbi:MAG: SOS response-associated peptidase family protein, partial [SAR324 cluster bacterium]|nr:SOS response-associated peptidase family protein [SAR324 cluster bacterium]
RTCAILTIVANSLMKKIHHRMPVILTPSRGSMWLEFSEVTVSSEKLLRPFPADKMESWRVSQKVNAPSFDNPDCLSRLEKDDAAEKNPEPPAVRASHLD